MLVIKKLIYRAVLLSFVFSSSLAAKTIEIPLWYSLSGHLGNVFQSICDDFNYSQQDYRIDPIYKGSYAETLTSYVAAFRAHRQPPLVQIFEVGTATMLNPAGVIKPMHEILDEADLDIEEDDILPAIRQYYSDRQGRLLAMPFNSSVAVMYYNRDALKKAGISLRITTWPQVEVAAKKLLKSGFDCGFTTTYPSWTQLESFSAWHGLAFASHDNGFDGLNAEVTYNRPEIQKHIETLVAWQKQDIFVYGGRDDNASALFTSGRCPMMIQSSGAYMGLRQIVDFDLGVSPLPYWPQFRHGPQNTMIGGAALWASQGFDKKTYRGMAAFFAYLAMPEQQAKWQRESGYLPVTHAAWSLNLAKGIAKKVPAASVAVSEVDQKRNGDKHSGLRLGSYAQIRVLNDEQLEAAFSGKKSAKEALDTAVARANHLLTRFRGNVS